MNTVVVGAGPAGLAGAFWRLCDRPDADVLVLEAAPRAGGNVCTERIEGYLCEVGPQALRPSPELDALTQVLGAGGDVVAAADAARTRWLGRGGRLRRLPAGPLGLLATGLLSLRGKLRLCREPFVAGGDPAGESVAAFMARRFGAETAPLAAALMRGIFAGDAERLELESAFPALARAEREHGSVLRGLRRRPAGPGARAPRPRPALCTFRGGMTGLVGHLASVLGERLRCGAAVAAVGRSGGRWRLELAGGRSLDADEVVLACPARASARLLRSADPELASELAGVPYASVASVYLGLPARGLPRTAAGFGFLLEPGEPSPVLGAIYCSNLFPEHAPAGQALLRVMIGGARRPDAVELDDGSLVRLATDALRRYAGIGSPPVFEHVARVRDAIPQYELGHRHRLERIERLLARHPGLSLRGNSYRAVALAGQLGRASGTDVAGVRPPAGAAERARATAG